nr:ABC transporter substrate-binding protein [Pantoea sp. 201603H]
MLLTRRVFIQALVAGLAAARLPATADENPTIMTIGTLPAASDITRVLSAGPPADILMLAVAPEKLIGFSSFDFSGNGCAWLGQPYCQLPKLGRLAGRASTLPLEKLLLLDPELIIDCGNVDDTWISQARRVYQQTGIPWLLIKGELKNTDRQLQAAGNRLGMPARAALQAQLAQRFLTEAQAFARRLSSPIRFYAARGARGLETGLRGSLHTEAAEQLGLENVAVVDGRSGIVQVSMEHLLLWQPDIILVQDRVTLHAMMTDPLWQRIRAIARQQILLFSGLPFGWMDAPPGINRLLGMRKLQAHFDPAVAATLKQDIALFFKTFWHTSLTASQCNTAGDLA